MMSFDWESVTSNVLLFFLLFGMSATVDFTNLVAQLKNLKAIGSGVVMQYAFMPLLGFLSVIALGDLLEPSVGITLLVVTSSPGGSYSNWWCSLFNADLALSVAMTALSTILSVFMLPMNLVMYSKLAFGRRPKDTVATEAGDGTALPEDQSSAILHSIDWATMFITLTIVLVAILSGLYASYLVSYRVAAPSKDKEGSKDQLAKQKRHGKHFRRICNRMGSLCGILLVIFSAALSSGSSETRIWNQSWAFYVAVSSPCLAGLVLANLIAGLVVRLKRPEQVTVSVECCYQNVGIATSVAMSMFDDPIARGNALCVPILYGLTEAVTLAIYCLVAWKLGWTKAPANENICVVLATSYEVGTDDTETVASGDVEKQEDIANVDDDALSAPAHPGAESGDDLSWNYQPPTTKVVEY